MSKTFNRTEKVLEGMIQESIPDLTSYLINPYLGFSVIPGAVPLSTSLIVQSLDTTHSGWTQTKINEYGITIEDYYGKGIKLQGSVVGSYIEINEGTGSVSTVPLETTRLEVLDAGDSTTQPSVVFKTHDKKRYYVSMSDSAPPSGGGGTADDKKLMISSGDTTADYLVSKLVAGTDISLTKQNTGANENIKIDFTGTVGADDHKVMASSGDTTPDYLESKLIAGTDISITKGSSGADETLTFAYTGTGGGTTTVSYTLITEDGDILITEDGNTLITEEVTISVSTDKVKISSADTTSNYLESKLIAGTNVTITKGNTGADETLTIASSGSGSGGLTKIAEYTVTDTAITDYTFSDISSDDYDFFNLNWEIYNPLESGIICSMYINGDTTDTNYWDCYFYFPAPGIVSGNSNTPARSGVPAGDYTNVAYENIRRGIDGKPRYAKKTEYSCGASSLGDTSYANYNVDAEITSFTIKSDVASGIGIGSHFVLYGMVK